MFDCSATIGTRPSVYPVEFELPGSEAIISRDGDRLVIEPVRSKGLAALLDSWEPLTEEFPQIADPPPTPEGIF
jgi:antitoxin VapB